MSYNTKIGANQSSKLLNLMDQENDDFQSFSSNFNENDLSVFQLAFLLLKAQVLQIPYFIETQHLQNQRNSNYSQNQSIYTLQCKNQMQKKNLYQLTEQLQIFQKQKMKNYNDSKKQEQEIFKQENDLDKLTPKTQGKKNQQNISRISQIQLQFPIKQEQKIVNKCNCKKSKCLKLYCECFRSGQTCGKDCVCIGCQNIIENQAKRQKIIERIIEKDDNAFLQRVKYNGCRCTKNKCSKNYCQCYRLGVGCGKYCRCLDCQNSGGRKLNKRKGKGKKRNKCYF